MNTRYFKVLDAKNRSCNGGSPDLVWSLPVQNADGSWTPGEWMPEVKGDLKLCSNGYHLTDAEHLPDWLNASIYEAEPSNELIKGDNKIVCRSVRLLRKMHWDDRVARLFACDCAERALPIYEKNYPDDKRPRHAIEVARLYADGKASDGELAAARATAWHAAWNAAWEAAWAAAQDAAQDAAGAAARGAAQGAARDKEHKWQVNRLMQCLEGKV
jgi:hypothetical protein